MTPALSIRTRQLILGLLLVVLVTLLAQTFARWELLEDPARRILYLPSGRTLQHFCFGYQELVADLLYLWSIQHTGDPENPYRYQYLSHVYDVITDLDPAYTDAYLIGSLILIREANDLEAGLRLLDKGIAANPDNWLLPTEAGNFCFFSFEDPYLAEFYYDEALRRPGVPDLVRRLKAALIFRRGDYREALAFWLEILETTEDEYTLGVARARAHDLKIRVDLLDLQGAVRRFHGERGRLPATLDDLARLGYLPVLPTDPEGNPYTYDLTTGAVGSAARVLIY